MLLLIFTVGVLSSRFAGMPKRSYTDFFGGPVVLPSVAARRVGDVVGGTKSGYRFRSYAGPRRFYGNRFYQGRGVRSGTYANRRYRGLRRYPQSGIETKYWDSNFQQLAIPVPPASDTWAGMEMYPGPNTIPLNCPTQGSGNQDREGRFITMESVQISGVVTIASQIETTGQTADTLPVVKVWIVLDKNVNGTDLASENVYTNPAGTSITGLAPLRNLLYSKRYKVLKEIDIPMRTILPTGLGTDIFQAGAHEAFDCFIKLKGLKTEFLANAGNTGDLVNNAIFVMAAASNNSYAPKLQYNSRLRFRG